MNETSVRSRVARVLVGALLSAGAGSMALVTGQSTVASAACDGCVVLVAPAIDLNVTAEPGKQAVIDREGGVAIYTPLTTTVAGEPGTMWLVGHRTTHGSVFNRVPTLKAGDLITLVDDAGSHRYIVSRLFVVPESGWESHVDIHDKSRPKLILQTSHPESHLRYLVEAFGIVPGELTANFGPWSKFGWIRLAA